MKKIIIIIILLLTQSLLFAQQEDKGTPLSIGYMGQFGIHPGLKIGTAFSLTSWDNSSRFQDLILSPQIGVFSYRGYNTNVLLLPEIGLRRQKAGKKAYSILGAGIGYMLQIEILTTTPNFNGEITSIKRETRSLAAWSLSYTLGREIRPSLDFYAKTSYGSSVSGSIESSALVLFELGLTKYLN